MNELASRLKESSAIVVIDVRGPDEFTGPLGHIASAKNLPVGELPDRLRELAACKDMSVVLVCRADKRSANADECSANQASPMSACCAAAWNSGTPCRSKAGCRQSNHEKDSMKSLFVMSNPPYGTERCYNALRLASALKNDLGSEVVVFLMADAVLAAKAGQKTTHGYYNKRMLKRVLTGKEQVLLCGTCMDARGLTDAKMMAGPRRSSMDELAAVMVEADKVLVF